MEERREFPRICKEARVDIRELAYPILESDLQKTTGSNIGSGGVRILVDEALEPGILLELKLDLSGVHAFKRTSMFVDTTAIEPLTVIGKVVWCRPSRDRDGLEAGVEFVDIYEDDRHALEKYLALQTG